MDDILLLKSAVLLLLDWYRVCKRDLPWRKDKEAYHVWVSEIMLQQTRVEAVKDYYIRFLEKFPDPARLARAGEGEVLKAWEGLGYYSRARNLHKAAKRIAEEGFPVTFEGVRALPGIGDYTAGAICSIAYDLPCPAVDGNVLRILTRLFADTTNIDEPGAKRAFSALLKEVYPPEAGDFCQALMELGAIVCVPNGAPLCGACPWRTLCRAHLSGKEEAYPVRGEKKARKVVPVSVFVLENGGMYALQKRADKGMLAGLWQFPLFGEESAPKFGSALKTKTAKHIFTHVEWRMTGYFVRTEERFPEYVWATAREIKERYALPSAFRPFFEWLK